MADLGVPSDRDTTTVAENGWRMGEGLVFPVLCLLCGSFCRVIVWGCEENVSSVVCYATVEEVSEAEKAMAGVWRGERVLRVEAAEKQA